MCFLSYREEVEQYSVRNLCEVQLELSKTTDINLGYFFRQPYTGKCFEGPLHKEESSHFKEENETS